MSLKSEMNFNDYINVVKRKSMIALIFFIIAFLITIAYALYLPPVYESTGTILIETPQLTEGDSKGAFAEDSFASLKETVMTNERLVNLAKKYNLWDLNSQPALDNDGVIAIADSVRRSLDINLLQADAGSWGRKTTFAFKISSQFNTAENAHQIAKEVIDLFLKQNAEKEQTKATDSVAFYAKAAKERKSTLETIERQIEAYKGAHASALPQNAQIHASSIERSEADLRDVQRSRNVVEADLRILQDSLEEEKLAESTIVSVEASNTELDKLNLELTKLHAIYNDNHPAVKALKRKIAALGVDQDVVTTPIDSPIAKRKSANVAKIERQIATAKAQLRSYADEVSRIRERIALAETNLARSAQTDSILGTLERKYKDAVDSYALAKSKLDSAKMEQNIQLENKGERFVLVESPVLPSSPIKPNRVLLVLLGLIASIGGAIGLPIVIEALDSRVRGVENIGSIMKLQPMASIPYIKNEGDETQVKFELYNIIYIVFSVVVLALIIVHFLVMPLDEIAAQMYNS